MLIDINNNARLSSDVLKVKVQHITGNVSRVQSWNLFYNDSLIKARKKQSKCCWNTSNTFSAPKPPLTGCWHITHSGFFKHWWKMVPSIWICHFCKLCFVWCIPVRISVIWGAVQLMIVIAKRIKFPAQEQGVPVIQVVVKRFLSLVVKVFPASSFSRCYQVLMRFYAVNITRTLKNIVSFSSPEPRIL